MLVGKCEVDTRHALQAAHLASVRRLSVFCQMNYVQQRLRVRISPTPTRGHWALLVFYRAVQKSLRMKPLGVGVWEYVGVKKTPVRPHSHTQLRSARAFSIEIGANRLRSSALIGNPSLIGLRTPVGAVVRRPMSCRLLSQSPPRDGRSGVTERPDGPGTQSEQAILREVEAGPQWEPRGSVTTWPLPDRADSAFPHIRFRVFPTDTSAVMKVIVTYIRSIVQDRVVGRLREMKVPGASLSPVHGFGLERPSHDWWVSPPRPANRQFHERCVFASIPLPP
jgi:hypothetical protein